MDFFGCCSETFEKIWKEDASKKFEEISKTPDAEKSKQEETTVAASEQAKKQQNLQEFTDSWIEGMLFNTVVSRYLGFVFHVLENFGSYEKDESFEGIIEIGFQAASKWCKMNTKLSKMLFKSLEKMLNSAFSPIVKKVFQ